MSIALAGLAATTLVLSTRQTEEEKRIEALNNKIKEQTSARKELYNERQKEVESSLREIDNVENLINELNMLVDSNGKVKDGYEERVNFILNEFNSAMGTEYSLVDGVIQKYNELNDTLELVLAKKRAEVILGSQEQDYKDAKENIDEYTKSLTEAEKAQENAQKEYNNAVEELKEYQENVAPNNAKLEGQVEGLRKELDEANKSLKDAQSNYDSAMGAITTYETNSLRMQTNDINELNKIISTNTRVLDENGKIKKEVFSDELESQIRQTKSINEEYSKRIKNADDYEKQVLESNRRMYQQTLNDTITTLVSQTSAINENSPAVEQAWKTLAESSIGQYQATLATLPEDVRNAVVNMTGVAYNETEAVALAWANMAITSEQEFKNNISMLSPDMQEQILNLVSIINENGGEVTDEARTLADNVINELNRQGEAEVAGVNLTRGFAKGINSEEVMKELRNSASVVAGTALGTLQKILDEHSPSRKTRKFGNFFTEGLTLGILDEEKNAIKAAKDLGNKVLNELDNTNKFATGSMDANINRQITDATKTIFTTPNIQFNVQTLNKENLDLAFNYINKKFGSQY